MAKRILAGNFVVILAAGSLIAPEALARGRGPSGGPMTAPHALHAPVGKTVTHTRAHLGLRAARLDRRRDLGLPLAGWWGSGWYGGYYDPSNYTMLHDRPALAEPFLPTAVPSYPPLYSGGPYPAPFAAPVQKPVDVIVYRPGCSSETETIPWSDGKERAITMVRC
jgi:hypothetical protein